MNFVIDKKGIQISADAIVELIKKLLDEELLKKKFKGKIKASQLRREIGDEALRKFQQGEASVSYEDAWKLLRIVYKYGLFELIPAHGIPAVPYNLLVDITDVDVLTRLKPLGYEQTLPKLSLQNLRTNIAGHWVDFPIGLPASIIAAHSEWIDFFAKRGFCILTYKTVRTVEWQAHPKPNWVFLRDAIVNPEKSERIVDGTDYWPENLDRVSMANSFGVPSFEPDWWEKDLARTRAIVREGHQVLIASVVASVEGDDAITKDFVDAAIAAAKAGADIVELNCSCPNTKGEFAGLVYKHPEFAARIAKEVQEALRPTKTGLFVKIGYLAEKELAKFVFATAPFIDGIVAINTISAKIKTPNNKNVFPDNKKLKKLINREEAGVSGWAIQQYAEEVARNLVKLRAEVTKEHNKEITILSVGGVLNNNDFRKRLQTGVDGVEICTGAFLNPHIALQIRLDESAINGIIAQEDHSTHKGATEGARAKGVLGAPDPGSKQMNEPVQAPSYVALTFASNSDAQYAANLYRQRRPSRNLAMPNPLTLAINSDDLAWLQAELADKKVTLHRVRTFAEISPDEAAKRRERGFLPNGEFATAEGRDKFRKEIEERIRKQ